MQFSKPSIVLAASLVSANTLAADEIPPEQLEFFETRIRPVLVEHCYSCHNSADTAEGDLALDHRTALRKGGGSGPLINEKNPRDSLLLSVIRHDIEGLEMPDGGPKLDDRTVADFETWINMGAPDPRGRAPSPEEVAAATSWEAKLERRKQWWSFQPIRKNQPPIASDWSDHPIDRFVARRLNDAGLEPAALAAPSVLVRRLFFNLIGLPPSADQAKLWSKKLTEASNNRASVVEELVDELLASPHFGERWARHWMDWIRYAESHGSEGDPRIENAWYYRDYLIRALNDDVPCDQLLREHVAGDLLEDPHINEELGINESAIGTAHWRMVFHGFAPTDALDEKVRFTDDQINAFSKAFLGLTVSCARCHDHKFDAISQADYYALFGILGSCRPSRTVIDTPERQRHNRDELTRLKQNIREAIAADWSIAAEGISERLIANDYNAPKNEQEQRHSMFWPLPQLRGKSGPELEATLRGVFGEFANRQRIQDGLMNQKALLVWDLSRPNDYAKWFPTGSGLPSQPSAPGDFAIAPNGEAALLGVYPGGAYSHLLSTKSAARLTSPDFAVPADCELYVEAIGADNSTVRYVVQNYPRSGTVYPVKTLASAWNWQRFNLSYWQGDDVHVELTTAKDAPLLTKGNERSWFGIRRVAIVPKGTASGGESLELLTPVITQLQESTPTDFGDVCDTYQTAVLKAVQGWQQNKLTNDQAALLNACLEANLLPNKIEELPTARESIEEYRRLENEIAVPTRVPGIQETVARNQPLFHRGNHKQPQDEIPRRFLEAIDATPYESELSGRELLAKDLLRDDNPLTRRVLVNRVWHHLFGRGIVGTPGNFGRLGEKPTHPELLDWLAVRFVEDGWSLKKLIRSIVLTRTWQLSSRPTAVAAEKDPENQLLSHANVRRLEAESIRDSLLAVSGGLMRDVHGPPVGSGSPRRSIYVSVIRNSLDPFLRAFDFPEPFTSVGRRDVTNVPAQSLALMNDRQVRRYAEQWAAKVLRDTAGSDTPSRVRSMFLSAFGRPASDTDVSMIEQFLTQSQSDLEERHNELVALRSKLAETEKVISGILTPIRARLLTAKQKDTDRGVSVLPEPFAHWGFDDTNDSVGKMHLDLRNGARISDGELVVDGQGFAISQPVGKAITTKTLHVKVQLDDLNQRAGGAITIMSPNGVFFDSIVFAEQQPKHWLAGSNGFSRTQRFNGTEEKTAQSEPVDISIVYRADGTIIGYRNGQPYGKPYKSNGPYNYKADAIIGFGVRHLPAGGNRMLKARILDAKLFDRALTEDEVAATASGDGNYVSEKEVLAVLTAEQKATLKQLRQDIESASAGIKALGNVPETVTEVALWTELAQAMFTFKEFIYVR